MRAFLIGIFLCLSLPAHADNWCDNPVANICEYTRTDSIRAASYAQAVTDAFVRVHTEYPPLEAGHYLQKELSIQTSIWETAMADGEFVPRVATYFLKAIDLEVMAGRLNPFVAARMKATIGEIRYFPASEVYEWIATEPGAMREFNEIFEEVQSSGEPNNSEKFSTAAWTAYKLAMHCGKRGASDQALLATVGGKKTIILCPGLLLRNVALAHSTQELFDTHFLTIAHELGHAVDSRIFAETLPKFKGCVKENFAKDLFVKFDHPITPIQGKEAEKVDSHLAEISADFWAARAASLYLKEARDIQSRRDITKRLWQSFCGRQDQVKPSPMNDDGSHPGFAVRFAISMGRSHPERELLGCSPLPKPGSCGLDGTF